MHAHRQKIKRTLQMKAKRILQRKVDCTQQIKAKSNPKSSEKKSQQKK